MLSNQKLDSFHHNTYKLSWKHDPYRNQKLKFSRQVFVPLLSLLALRLYFLDIVTENPNSTEKICTTIRFEEKVVIKHFLISHANVANFANLGSGNFEILSSY